MKSRAVTVMGIVLACLSGCSKGSDEAMVQKEERSAVWTDFETQDIFPPWEKQCNEGTFEIVDSGARKGNRCAKFTIDSAEYWTSPNTGIKSARCEIQIFDVAPANREVYYGWSVKIPEDYRESTDWQVMGQFHDQPDYENGETWEGYPANSPPVAVTYRDGKLGITVNVPFGNGAEVISERPIVKGQWTDIVLRIYWSTGADGFIEAWVNGVPMTDKSGTVSRYTARNLYNGSGNYLKIGLYRSNEIKSKNSVYFDEIRTGARYDDVRID